MPELPDVAAFEQYFDSTSLHKRIEKTSVLDNRILKNTSPAALARFVKGRAFEQTRRHGKFLFARLTGRPAPGWLVLHFGMTGGLAYLKQNGALPDHARVLFDFSNGRTLAIISQRLFGRVGFTENLDQFLQAQNLGPDALDPDFTPAYLAKQAAKRRTPIKAMLLDQSVVAGLGNIYADEVLFQTGLHPKTRANRLDKKDVHRLHRVIRRVLNTALRHHANIKELPGHYLAHRRGKRQKCPVCGAPLKTTTIAGRTSYFCPNCQKPTQTRASSTRPALW